MDEDRGVLEALRFELEMVTAIAELSWFTSSVTQPKPGP